MTTRTDRTEENPLMKTLIVALTISTILSASPLYAGKHVKMCRDENGNPYVTDVSCPKHTEKVGTFYAPNAQGYQQKWSPADSAMLQDHEQRIQKNLAARAAPIQQQRPAMTYEDARAAATKDAGYQKYGQLSKSQKERVHDEMGKYNHLPPAPPPQNNNVRPNNAGAINPYTGEFYAPAGDGYVGTKDGTFYAPAGPNGVTNTRTGQFVPVH